MRGGAEATVTRAAVGRGREMGFVALETIGVADERC